MTTQNSAGGPFTGVRVLEIADEKGQWCGKLLGDLGADVIKIEPPGGESTRTVGPFYQDSFGRSGASASGTTTSSKRRHHAGLESEGGRGLFRKLTVGADVVIETFSPGCMASLGLGYEDLKELNPRIIVCSITPFGQTGPWRDFLSSDLLHLSVGGQMGSCGYDDVPDAPPIAPGGGQAWHMGGHYACMAITAALIHRGNTGAGQYIDLSIHESCALTTEGAMSSWIYSGKTMIRQTGRHAGHDPHCSNADTVQGRQVHQHSASGLQAAAGPAAKAGRVVGPLRHGGRSAGREVPGHGCDPGAGRPHQRYRAHLHQQHDEGTRCTRARRRWASPGAQSALTMSCRTTAS